MSEFPVLKTGAVMQYPAQKETRYSTSVVRFADGSEQRFRQYQGPLRRWLVQLQLLDETELAQIRNFFRSQSGPAGTFQFTDPSDGTVYSTCRVEDEEMKDAILDESACTASLTVCENRD